MKTEKILSAGFSLIELLVSIVIISIIGLVVVQSFFTTVKVNTKTEILREIKQNGDFAMNAITRAILNTANQPVTGPSITVTDPDGSNSRLIQIQGGKIVIGTEELTSDFVIASGLNFTVDGSRVTTEFTLTQASAVDQREEAEMKFETTTIIRSQSYD